MSNIQHTRSWTRESDGWPHRCAFQSQAKKLAVMGLGLFLSLPAACTKKAEEKATLPAPRAGGSQPVEEKTAGDLNALKDQRSPQENSMNPEKIPQNSTLEKDQKSQSEGRSADSEGTRVAQEQGASTQEADGQFRLVGEIAAQRKSQLAFRVGGFIEGTDVKPGNFVKKGATLARLEGRDFKLRFELAKIKRDGARQAFESASREYKRETALKQENASTESNYDKVKNAFDQAQIGLQMAEIDLRSAENALNDSHLVAPYDCVVASQLKYDGESVQSGTAVFEIYDVGQPELTLRAPERLLGQMTIGESITVRVPSAGYSGTAKIARIVPVVNEKTRTFTVTAQFDTFNEQLVPGLFVEGIVKKQSRNKL
jgi:RND family efflux transporter MFP subunit